MASSIVFAVFTIVPICIMSLTIIYSSIIVYKLNDLRPILLIALLTLMSLHQVTEIVQFISGTYYQTTSPTAEAFETSANLLASIGSYFVLQQITDLRTTRNKLRISNKALEERSSMVSVLNRILRHNVRNDVNIIAGLATNIRERIPNDSLRHDLKTIENTALGLAEISNRTQRMNRLLMEDSPSTSEIRLIDSLKPHIERLLETFPETEISVESPSESDVVIVVPSMFPTILADVIERIIVINDGSVQIELTVSKGQSQYDSKDDLAKIEIDDDGVGLPELDVEAIEAVTETPLQHAEGLSLWYLKWAVKRADGELIIHSETATIEILLPLADCS